METNVDRDQLAPYAAAVSGTLLVWPVIGVLAGIFLATFHFDAVALRIAAPIVYVVGVFAVVGWQVKKSGVQPSFRTMPPALKWNMYGFWIAGSALIALAVSVALATNFLLAGLTVGVAFTILGLIYHVRSRSIINSLLAAA